MDTIYESFLNLHTAAFIIGCYALTWLTRRLFETWKPSLRPNKKNHIETYKTKAALWWNSFILYLIPPAWGVLGGWVLYPYLHWPSGFESLQAVMFFGMVCGWVSGLVYKFLMKLLLKKMGATDEQAEKAAEKFEGDPKVAGEDKKKRKIEKPEDSGGSTTGEDETETA